MNIEEALVAYLKADTAVKGLVSTRIHYEEQEQSSSLPAIDMIKISDFKDHYLTGKCELERPIYQLSCKGLTKASAKSVSDAVKSALSDYQGIMNGVVVQKIELRNENSSLDKSNDGTTKVYFEDLEFEINYIKE